MFPRQVFRQHVDSAYPAIKTEFEIATSADVYMRSFMDLRERRKLEPYLVEALHVDTVAKVQDPMSLRHIPLEGCHCPGTRHQKGCPCAGAATPGTAGDAPAPPAVPDVGRRSSRATTPPPRLPSMSTVRGAAGVSGLARVGVGVGWVWVWVWV